MIIGNQLDKAQKDPNKYRKVATADVNNHFYRLINWWIWIVQVFKTNNTTANLIFKIKTKFVFTNDNDEFQNKFVVYVSTFQFVWRRKTWQIVTAWDLWKSHVNRKKTLKKRS